jgi:para-aminobenzoate synthetase component 1
MNPNPTLSLQAQNALSLMNNFGANRRPFLFIIDFTMQQPLVLPLDEVNTEHILFNINGIINSNAEEGATANAVRFEKYPPDFERYKTAFQKVREHLLYGNSFLVNLTLPSLVDFDLTLKEIFFRSKAAYKLWFKDQFVVFSPELFVRIANGQIESQPMKGTIDAALPDAENHILSDPKEIAEHNTIVDLIRNDLNRVARNVRVEKFRFITPVITNHKTLLQVSSSVVGDLDKNYNEQIGDLIFSLLPAGSISGAPKKKTVEIILEAENYDRGFYTGIFGIFDGHNLDSGVMIRFIENINGKFWFKSGGGVTVNSNCEDEYGELTDKVYLPF